MELLVALLSPLLRSRLLASIGFSSTASSIYGWASLEDDGKPRAPDLEHCDLGYVARDQQAVLVG